MLPNLNPLVPIRAKVRTGLKVGNKPKASDNFHSTDADFTRLLGTPKQLIIRFPLPNPDDSLKTSLELWGSNGTLKCWCADTVTAHRLGTDGNVTLTPCTHPTCQQYAAGNCTPVGRLKFEIPELGPGIFQLDTKSWNSITVLAGALSVFNPIPKEQCFELFMVKKRSPKGVFNVLHMKPVGGEAAVDPTQPHSAPEED